MNPLLLAMLLSTPAAGPPCVPELPQAIVQGGLVIGRIDAGCSVQFGGRPLRIATDGTFVFGVGRDAPRGMSVEAGPATGPLHRYQISVGARRWQIERVDGVPESTVNPPPEIAARIQAEQARVARARERDDPRQDFRFGFIRPLAGRISGVYGSQRVLNGTPKSPHMGLDIAAPNGARIVAPAAGIVTFADPSLYLTGGTLLIDHGHGLSSVFIHLSRIDVKVGARIEQGQPIAAVGATGRANGPHLHWGFNWFGERLDPALLIADAAP